MPAGIEGLFTPEQLRTLSGKSIFFAHQSVGSNVVQGVRDLMTAEPRLQLKIVHADRLGPVAAGTLVEFSIGQNGDPASKDHAFGAALNNIGRQPAVAMYKYCYVDMRDSTDAQQLFHRYHANVSRLKATHPSLTFVHVTMPLTTVESKLKAAAKNMLGSSTERDLAVKRNEFNELLRQAFQGSEPLFDLAEAESTRLDGSRTYFIHDGRKIYTLAPEFTTDGGHLNELGRRIVAARLVRTLASF